MVRTGYCSIPDPLRRLAGPVAQRVTGQHPVLPLRHQSPITGVASIRAGEQHSTRSSEWKGRAAHPAFCKSVSAHGVVWVLAGSESMGLVATVRACVCALSSVGRGD